MKKKKYDTSVIMLYLLRQEHLLPKQFRQKIPYSTISSWRKTPLESYEGSQFRFLFDDKWDVIGLKHENRRLKCLLRSITKSYVAFKLDIEDFIKSQKRKKEFQTKLLFVVSLLKSHVKLELALKILFVHRNQFYEWMVASRHNCSHSFSSLCLKKISKAITEKGNRQNQLYAYLSQV
jgi:hypothetical protein